jgi:hypothetical protein
MSAEGNRDSLAKRGIFARLSLATTMPQALCRIVASQGAGFDYPQPFRPGDLGSPFVRTRAVGYRCRLVSDGGWLLTVE